MWSGEAPTRRDGARQMTRRREPPPGEPGDGSSTHPPGPDLLLPDDRPLLGGQDQRVELRAGPLVERVAGDRGCDAVRVNLEVGVPTRGSSQHGSAGVRERTAIGTLATGAGAPASTG